MSLSKSQLEAVRREAWTRGNLRHKLDSNQIKIVDYFRSFSGGSVYLNKARRIGGSYMLLVMAVEECLKKKHAQVKYAAPTAKNVRKIITPNLRKIMKDCPEEMRPKWNNLEGEWRFPHNGSILTVAGCDNQQYENLRGTESDAIFLDEVGFMQDLRYILSDVLSPQVQDTNGLIVLTSTPPRSPSHEAVQVALEHKAGGRYYHSVVWDNPRRTRDQHTAFFSKVAESHGQSLEEFYSSTTFRREYLGEFIADSERSVVPEWSDEVERKLVREVPEPKHRDTYVGIDPGWKDGTAAVFGYWDFIKGRLVIVDEFLVFRKNLTEVIYGIKEKELNLWGDGHKPFMRVCDNQLQIISEFNQHGLVVNPTRKDNKELQINNLRELIRLGKIIIHPRCKRLISQLAGTIWNEQRTSYERSRDGHGDLLDSLVYLARNVARNRNPIPLSEGLPTDISNWHVSDAEDIRKERFAKDWESYVPSLEMDDFH